MSIVDYLFIQRLIEFISFRFVFNLVEYFSICFTLNDENNLENKFQNHFNEYHRLKRSNTMSQVPYTPLIETVEMSRANLNDSTEHLCRICRNKIAKKQPVDHNPMECLSQRCEFLETEVMKLKDHDVKSRIQIKDLESKISSLEEAVQSLTAPKQTQAAPFNFSSGQKLRNPFKKAQSVDLPALAQDSEVNYDNILPLKRSGSRERVGLFGSLGASSQYR